MHTGHILALLQAGTKLVFAAATALAKILDLRRRPVPVCRATAEDQRDAPKGLRNPVDFISAMRHRSRVGHQSKEREC